MAPLRSFCVALLLPPALVATSATASSQSGCASKVLHQDLDAGTSAPRLRTPDGAAVVDAPISFQVEDGLPLSFGILFHGPEAPFFDPNLNAVLYPGPPFFIQAFLTDADGSSPRLLQTGALDRFLCGEQVAIQSAVLDPAAPDGVAVSNALRVRVGVAVDPVLPGRVVDLAGETFDLAVADFDGDGLLDVGTANRYSDSISVALAGADRRFGPATAFPATAFPFELECADFDEDGNVDLFAALSPPGQDDLVLFRGNGDGSFGPRRRRDLHRRAVTSTATACSTSRATCPRRSRSRPCPGRATAPSAVT